MGGGGEFTALGEGGVNSLHWEVGGGVNSLHWGGGGGG